MNYRRVQRMPRLHSRLAWCLAWIVASGAVAFESPSRDSTSGEEQKVFDPSRRVVLQGDEARKLVAMCFGTTESSGWKIPPIDIQDLERELAPLLAADLESVGFAATPNRYYRQYASGKIDGREAIFINGFHESYLSYLPSGDHMRWRSDVVRVSDGGENFWCAVYVKSLKQHFVTYKDPRLGGRNAHVSFHGFG
jgi:hypothetical protein